MIRATVPAVSGQDSLVPPNGTIGCGSLAPVHKLAHSVNVAVSVEQSAQLPSAGAATVAVSAFSLKPELEIGATLLCSQPCLSPSCAPYVEVCAYIWYVVVPAAAMTPLAVAGVPIVLVVPASPVLATTLTPFCTARASKSASGSSAPVFGSGLPPIDSLSTST